jgi:hypothetical protein
MYYFIPVSWLHQMLQNMLMMIVSLFIIFVSVVSYWWIQNLLCIVFSITEKISATTIAVMTSLYLLLRVNFYSGNSDSLDEIFHFKCSDFVRAFGNHTWLKLYNLKLLVIFTTWLQLMWPTCYQICLQIIVCNYVLNLINLLWQRVNNVEMKVANISLKVGLYYHQNYILIFH